MTTIGTRLKGAAGVISGMRVLLFPRRSIGIVIAILLPWMYLNFLEENQSWSVIVFMLWWWWLRDLARLHCDGQAAFLSGLGREVGYAWSLAIITSIVCLMLDAWSPQGIHWQEFNQTAFWLGVFTVALLCTPRAVAATICVLLIAYVGVMFLRLEMDIDLMAWIPGGDAGVPGTLWFLLTLALMTLAWRLWRRMLALRWESGMSGAYPLILILFPSSSVNEETTRKTNWYARLHGLCFKVLVKARPALRAVYKVLVKVRHALRAVYAVGLLAFWVADPSRDIQIFFALILLPDCVLKAISLMRLKQVVPADGPTSELLATLPASAAPRNWRMLALKVAPSSMVWIILFFVMAVLLWLRSLILDQLQW